MVRHSARRYHHPVIHTVSAHADHLLVSEAESRELPYFSSTRWETADGIDSVKGRRLFEMTYRQTDVRELVCEFGPGLVYIRQMQNTVIVTVAAPTREYAEEALVEIRAVLPELAPVRDAVPALFWWMSNSPRSTSNLIPTFEWKSICANYVGEAKVTLEEMCGWQRPPAGGQLIVWHGAPGTGKTSALRLLAGSWKQWAKFHFITDPESFLHSPSYLLEVMTEGREPDDREHEWRVVVLEDAGEFLAPDAKHQNGQAVSRLLNICDGVVGQSMRALVLITTNEPLRRLPPALTRPGRLLRSTEFTPMDAEQSAGWLADRGVDALDSPPAAAMTLADLFAVAEGRSPGRPSKQTPTVGFGLPAAA